MTTSTLEVGDLFSILGARGIERQLRRIAGVSSVSPKVTVKTSTAPQHTTTRECGGGKTPSDATATALAVPPPKQAAPGSSPKRVLPTTSQGSCCG